ncbi:MAG TPA: reverse transcriptase-like protein, partial [Bacillaceae bacterium]
MNIKMKFTYKGPKTPSVVLESDWISEEDSEPIMDDLMKTGRVLDLVIEDEMGNEWNRKEYAKLRQKLDEKPRNPIVFFDGGFNKGSGKAGIGMVVYYEKGTDRYRIRANGLLDALETNNEAEYAALYNSLLLLEEAGIRNIPCTIKGDSLGVLKQLEGEWPCYEPVLNAWLDRIESKLKELGIKPAYLPVGRNENKEADKLAGQALSENIVYSHLKIG